MWHEFKDCDDCDPIEECETHDLVDALQSDYFKNKLTQEHIVILEEIVRDWKNKVIGEFKPEVPK